MTKLLGGSVWESRGLTVLFKNLHSVYYSASIIDSCFAKAKQQMSALIISEKVEGRVNSLIE